MGYLVGLEPVCDSNYVLLSNIYAALGKWISVGEVRGAMTTLEMNRRPGFTAVEIDRGIHEFILHQEMGLILNVTVSMICLTCFTPK
ncbi:hypothetical protein DsansV1_C49g0244411 [Dioscorea sansibarensis]